MWEAVVDTFFTVFIRIFSSYFFVSDIFSFERKEKHPVGHLSLSNIEFSKFVADVSIAQEIQDSNTFSGIFQPRI